LLVKQREWYEMRFEDPTRGPANKKLVAVEVAGCNAKASDEEIAEAAY
jgi:hypothetical protein